MILVHESLKHESNACHHEKMPAKVTSADYLYPGRHNRGGQKTKSHNFDGCPMASHFIGLWLLRTVFGIALACREGPVPAFSCIAGDIGGGISKNRFRAITFDWSVLRT